MGRLNGNWANREMLFLISSSSDTPSYIWGEEAANGETESED